MTKPELMKSCGEKFGRHSWVLASVEELELCLSSGAVPAQWANGRSTSAAVLGGALSVPASPVPSPSPVPESGAVVNEMSAADAGESSPGGGASLEDILAARLAGRIKPGLDTAAVEKIASEVASRIAKEMIDGAPVKRIEIAINDKPAVRIDGEHVALPLLVKFLSARVPVLMVGPAGSGKTTGAERAASILGLEFFPLSVGPQTSKSDLLGYFSAGGAYVPSLFRKAYESGGLVLLDEFDAGNAAVLTIINAALANGYCSFPDGVIKRHDKCFFVAAANTWGRGADRLYVGRAQLDAATLNRFVCLAWDYDESLERRIAANDTWVDFVQSARKAMYAVGVRHIISPRASISGAALLAQGVDRAQVESSVVWCGLDAASVEKIKQNMGA